MMNDIIIFENFHFRFRRSTRNQKASVFKNLPSGLIFGGAYIRRGLSTEGNLRFKIDWASLIVGSKFTVFALFYFVFEGNFPSTSPRGTYIWRGDLTEGFLRYWFGGLINGGAYFRNFTVCFYPVTSQDRTQFFTVNLQDGAERNVIAFLLLGLLAPE